MIDVSKLWPWLNFYDMFVGEKKKGMEAKLEQKQLNSIDTTILMRY